MLRAENIVILILKIRKSKICRGAVGGGWGEILGNVYISWMCCGVCGQPHIPVVVGGG